MTIGRNSRKGSVRSSIRAPKFLDKSSGFYGRLDEPEVTAGGQEVDCNADWGDLSGGQSQTVTHTPLADERDEAETFDFSGGLVEDDGETLLHRKPGRRSSRWRRSSRRKQKEEREEADTGREERPSQATAMEAEIEKMRKAEEEEREMGRGREPVVHFPVRENEDDQVLIRDKKRGREEEEEEEEEEERKIRREQEEAMKVVKRKNYRKALDRVFRRGWEAFINNLYSVTLTPTTSSSHSSPSPSSKKKLHHTSVLAEIR